MSTELLERPTGKQIAYSIADDRIAELGLMYLGLSINGVEDREGFDVVHKARITIRDHRVDVEKTRKQLKAESLEFSRRVDAEAKRLTSLLEPIEAHLEAEENRIAEEKARIKAEKENAAHAAAMSRMNALVACGVLGADYAAVRAMSSEEFDTALAEAMQAHKLAKEQAAAEKAERDRLEALERQRIADEKAEQARLQALEDARRKTEAEALAKERAEFERQRAEDARRRRTLDLRLVAARAAAWGIPVSELEALTDEGFKNGLADAFQLQQQAEEKASAEKAELEQQRKAQQAEADRLAAERRKMAEEQAAKDRADELERAKVEAAEKARLEAHLQAQREAEEAKQRAEAEEAERKRIEALRPDREKLRKLATDVLGIEQPELSESSHEAQAKVDRALTACYRAICKIADEL